MLDKANSRSKGNVMESEFLPGNLVKARSRTWVVQNGSTDDWLKLRPVGGADDEITELLPALEKEPVTLAQFEYPDPNKVGPFSSAEMLYDALRFQLRSGAGPFRSFGSIAVEPRSYQLVPLLMAMRLKVVRLLIADDVGVGKTIEAGLILREMIDRGEIERIAVLCPPHLVEQWVKELSEHFNFEATALTASSAARLEKGIPHGKTLADVYPVLVVSLDYIKSEKHRDYFLTMAPELVIVDEAHTCVKGANKTRQLRFELLQKLAEDSARHMLLLTATPHSGNEESFYNLLSLLDKEFLNLYGREVTAKDPLRKRLAQHFVQRRRKDIEEWRVSGTDRMTGFPIRKTAEITYRLDSDWDKFFDDLQAYCRTIVEKHKENQLIWFAVLSLFRCVSSSPAAAVQALSNHLNSIKDLSASELRTDLDDIDEATDTDIEPTIYLEESKQLEELIERARKLAGTENDPKVRKLVDHVRALIKEGFSPVVFCRFVATAQYVYEALKREFSGKNIALECVTGELVPDERKARVASLSDAEQRILVATDCLSEGINLQEYFTSVIHYDLAWNPTRHEQREGRVDRFGQKAPEIRCTMMYGENNPVDGFILQVILRKSAAIRKELGVIVSMPEEKKAISKAIIQAALFKERNKKNLAQWSEKDQLELFAKEDLDEINTMWTVALDNESKQRTVFAQQSIHPDAVYPLWQAQQEALGAHCDVERFSKNACASLGCQLEPVKTKVGSYYKFPLVTIQNPSLKTRFEDEGFKNNEELDFSEIHRSSTFVNVLSEGIVQEALEGKDNALVSRCAIAETESVENVTRIYLLRLRYQIHITYRNQKRRFLLAEEIVPLAVRGTQNPQWDTSEKVRDLFDVKASGNFPAALAQKQIREAVEYIRDNVESLKQIADDRSKELFNEHNQVKEYTSDGSASRVVPCMPIDVMGVFVLLPSDI